MTVKRCGNLLVSIIAQLHGEVGDGGDVDVTDAQRRGGPLYITSGGVGRQSSFKVRYDSVSIGIERRESTNIVVVSGGN